MKFPYKYFVGKFSRQLLITTYIELPEPYDVNDIDASTVRISYVYNNPVDIPAAEHPIEIADYDGDSVLDLMVKFARSEVKSEVNPGEHTVTVTGELTDGTVFEGYGIILVR